MIENWKSVRLRFQMSFVVAFFVLLNFGSCSSLSSEGSKDFMKCKEMAVKAPFASSSAWKDGEGGVNQYSNGVTADSRTVGYNRKLLGRFYNPYPTLAGNHPVATVTPLAPSPTPIGKGSDPLPPMQTNSHKQGVSDPPPSAPDLQETPQTNSSSPRRSASSSDKAIPIVSGCISSAVFLILLAAGVFVFRLKAGKSVNPWRTGLSGQLQKAFVTGVPKLKRSDIQAACEDFSNVIGSCPIGTLFKGTLSSGVEIAVASVAAMSAKDWKENVENEFRKKIGTLSKINHKNFVNLLGYCEEDKPFTRIMVFEYVPNGSLFEHLHSATSGLENAILRPKWNTIFVAVKESEHLDWGMRLRIAMGIAYCLDYMHQLKPPVPHSYLCSSMLHLTEDYAVKVADFSFGNQQCPSVKENSTTALIDTHVSDTSLEDNVYSFGVLLFEMMTGKLPDSVSKDNSVDNGLTSFLAGVTLTNMADSTLKSFDEKIEKIGEVIKSCIKIDPRERPTIRDVAVRLREITGISPDEAVPKLLPLWWEELEVMSTA